MEKILRKIYPGRQIEFNIRSQQKIDRKIKGVKDDDGKNRENENIPQNDRKTEIKTEECELQIDDHNGKVEKDEKTKEYTGNEK